MAPRLLAPPRLVTKNRCGTAATLTSTGRPTGFEPLAEPVNTMRLVNVPVEMLYCQKVPRLPEPPVRHTPKRLPVLASTTPPSGDVPTTFAPRVELVVAPVVPAKFTSTT